MVRVMVDEELNSDLMAPRHARQRVREQLGGAACEDDAVLVASELVTNAVSHGVPPIRLGLRLLPHCVRLEVHDGAGLVHTRQSDSRGSCSRRERQPFVGHLPHSRGESRVG